MKGLLHGIEECIMENNKLVLENEKKGIMP